MKTDKLYLIVLSLIGLFVIYGISSADNLSIHEPVGPYPASVTADEMLLDFGIATGGDTIDTVTSTGREILLIYNPDDAGGAATVTLDSVPNPKNRENDIEDYSLDDGEYAAFAFTNTIGWRNATGEIQISASSTDIWWTVVRLPR